MLLDTQDLVKTTFLPLIQMEALPGIRIAHLPLFPLADLLIPRLPLTKMEHFSLDALIIKCMQSMWVQAWQIVHGHSLRGEIIETGHGQAF